jgi:hypothetical protein
MKKFVNLLLTLSVLAGLGYVLWSGFQKHEASVEEARAETSAAQAEAEAAPESFSLTLDKEQATAAGIEKDQPEKMERPSQRQAYGTVLDPTPLITLDSDLAAATAALTASKAAHQRTLTLVATNDASKQAAETTLAQSTADQIKLDTLLRSARLQWANRFIGEPQARRLYTDQLISGNSVLIRIDTLPGDGITEPPRHATLTFPGHESAPIPCDDLEPATTTDPKTQSAGFILRLDQPPFPLRPGQSLTAWLELPGPPRPGLSIPRSAILRHDGRTWVYLQEEEEKYVRKPITLDSPLEGGQAWFITADNGITTEDLIVTTGASTLLSEELKAQGAAPEVD